MTASHMWEKLFSLLSHDLRTPLSAISGWLFLLESDKLDPAGRKRALDKIRANVDEEVGMIDDMLALVRCKAGTLQLEIQSTDARTVAEAAVSTMQDMATARHAVLRVEAAHGTVGAAPALVSVDPPRLQRALELLIDYALRSVNGRQGAVTVTPANQEGEGGVAIRIEHTGRGLSAAALPWLFDPFGQPPDPNTGSRHSPDRALLVAAALVEAQGGRIGAESPGEDAGATFTVVFPRAPVASNG